MQAGKPTAADIASPRMLHEVVLRERFDTLLVLDRKVKHEALPIQVAHAEGQAGGVASADPRAVAVRDVLTFEVRTAADSLLPSA
jgi:hypothetical protein